ncbi:MAG: ChaN family lipoprotein [Pseudomonadota bacterium]
MPHIAIRPGLPPGCSFTFVPAFVLRKACRTVVAGGWSRVAGVAAWLGLLLALAPLATAQGVGAPLAPVDAGPSTAPLALLIGEQHDQPDHQRQAAALVSDLATQGRLHALVLEMAQQGASTAGLPREASEAQVRGALQWDDFAWPWARYRELVLAAVRAGVPVWGANLPRSALKEAQADARWDAAIPAEAWSRLRDAVRDGHCGLVPDELLGPLVRMQIARDRSLAQGVAQQLASSPPARITVLHAGAVHAARRTGVPLHLPQLAPASAVHTLAFGPDGSAADFDERRPAREDPQADHCAALRERGMPLPGRAGAASGPVAASAADRPPAVGAPRPAAGADGAQPAPAGGGSPGDRPASAASSARP